MNKLIEILQKTYLNHLFLPITQDDLQKTESNRRQYSNQAGNNNAYINFLCLSKFSLWLKERLTPEAIAIPAEQNGFKFEESASFNTLKNHRDISVIWEVINGFPLEINGKTFIFIPSQDEDIESFSIAQEWVDIPSWAGDYYVPIQVDLANQFLHFWGFISYSSLKEKAEYDRTYRMYDIDADYLIDDFQLIWQAIELCEHEKSHLKPLSKLTETQAHELIAKLSEPSVYSPRLDLDFSEWASLISQDSWLKKLYHQRLNPVYNLTYWLKNIFQSSWLPPENLLSSQQLKIAPAIRATVLETTQDVVFAVTQMCETYITGAFRGVIPQEATRGMQIEEYLVYLLHSTSNDNMRWRAANYLWLLNPNHPQCPPRRVMSLKLGTYHIALMIAVFLKADGQYSLLSRVYPTVETQTLPPGLSLKGLDQNGQLIPRAEVTARDLEGDPYIQLIFKAGTGDRLDLCINLEDNTIIERFSF